MAVIFVVVLVLFVVVFPFFLVVLFFVLGHDQTVSSGITMEFVSVFCMFCQQVDIGGAWFRQIAAQFIDHKRFEIKDFYAFWHGVGC